MWNIRWKFKSSAEVLNCQLKSWKFAEVSKIPLELQLFRQIFRFCAEVFWSSGWGSKFSAEDPEVPQEFRNVSRTVSSSAEHLNFQQNVPIVLRKSWCSARLLIFCRWTFSIFCRTVRCRVEHSNFQRKSWILSVRFGFSTESLESSAEALIFSAAI